MKTQSFKLEKILNFGNLKDVSNTLDFDGRIRKLKPGQKVYEFSPFDDVTFDFVKFEMTVKSVKTFINTLFDQEKNIFDS